jgi:hypothetical protein
MLVTPGWGGCLTEFKQMEVALKQLTEQGRHSDARRTLVCMMALFSNLFVEKEGFPKVFQRKTYKKFGTG